VHQILNNRFLLGLADIIDALVRSPVAVFLLGVLSLAIGAIALVANSLAGAILGSSLILTVAIVAVGGFVIRDRFAGLYEILHDEDEWDLFDTTGGEAKLKKTRAIRFLQDEVFAIRDHAWGSGDVDLVDTYSCTPGQRVDAFWYGDRHHIIVSLREIKMRKDVGTYTITRTFRNSYLKDSEWLSAEIIHPTRSLTLRAVFPKERPPQGLWIKQRSKGDRSKRSISSKAREDGRQVVEESIRRPRHGEEYIIGWDW
jgi:hypothetical protein